MQELFILTLITAFVVGFISFVLSLIGATPITLLLVTFVLLVAAIIVAMRVYGVPESAFRSGGVIAMTALAATLVAGAVQEFLEFIVVIVLFVVAYFVGGLFGLWTLKKPR